MPSATLVPYGLGYAVKAFRVLAMWIVIYVTAKLYSKRHLRRVYLAEDDDTEYRPDERRTNLWTFALTCAAIESIGFLLLIGCLAMLAYKRRNPDAYPVFMIDEMFMQRATYDYVAVTLVWVAAMCLVASSIENCDVMRFEDDGLRGVRAYATIALYAFLVLVAFPFFALM